MKYHGLWCNNSRNCSLFGPPLCIIYLHNISLCHSTKEDTSMGKNKQVACQICFKPIRSDTLKRHMKVHEKYEFNIKFQTNEEICKDLVTSWKREEQFICCNSNNCCNLLQLVATCCNCCWNSCNNNKLQQVATVATDKLFFPFSRVLANSCNCCNCCNCCNKST